MAVFQQFQAAGGHLFLQYSSMFENGVSSNEPPERSVRREEEEYASRERIGGSRAEASVDGAVM